MSGLSDEEREELPSKEFGLPEKARSAAQKKGTGNYPMPDVSHARNAKARAAHQHERGNLSEDELARIDRTADRIIDDA